MCYFITLALMPAAEDRLRAELGRGFELMPTSNASVRRVLSSPFPTRLLTSGNCSCDLYRAPVAHSLEPSIEELRSKYEKSGWSKTKIDRVLAPIVAKRQRGPKAFSGLRADVASAVVAVARPKEPLALVVHMYTGAVESETLAISIGPRYRGEDFLTSMNELPVDTLVWVEATLAGERPH